MGISNYSMIERNHSVTTIYLCIKTHKITGLKYLCKTKSNPFKYNGSGADWKPHLKKYGTDHDTEIIRECSSNEELSSWGRYYSRLWNVVGAMDDYGNKIWANRIPETGGGLGGIPGCSRGEEFSKRCVINNTGSKNPSYGKYWWTNGIDEQKTKHQPGPKWYRGRALSAEHQQSFNKRDQRGSKNASYGKYWWTNGIDSIKSDKCPDGYYRGVGKIQREKSRNNLVKS
jgi:hypothetical protein